ncbi:hypothetical protein ONZ45_g14749 [Pleurotus djamor]|nr:hypothetical protein ONZ45_g14749 [Pleurotus djamor]
MNSTPTEIWTHIFAYASADDRRTARSLGEVSRYVREATRGVGMERVVLRSVEEVVWFAGYLEYLDGEFEKEREEGEKVRVKALDIALDIEGSDSPEAEGDGWLKWLKEGKERSTWGDDIPSFDTYITQSRVRGMAACDALERILKHIGGGVRDMSVWWNARYERRFGVLPIGLGPDHLTMQTADANGHLTNLNDAQRKGKDFLLPILSNPHNATFSAVHHPPHIPLQILAGPGSGKTRVLTSRIAHLILHHAIPSASICAVTFTNKAANEMKERLTKLLGAEQTRTLKLGTFHALCASFLRKYASLVGLSNNFSVCDADESKKIISRLLKPYKTFLDAKDITLKEGTVLSMISKHKYKGFTATEVLSELRTPPSVVSEKENITAQSKSKARSTEIDHVVAEVYREYEKALRKSNSLDFDDLLLFGLELFKHHEKSLIWCKHVLVDEFQDTNSIQYELMKTIANSASECLTVVGDPDQSIYGWRSADVTNLAKMRKDFAQTESVLLYLIYI